LRSVQRNAIHMAAQFSLEHIARVRERARHLVSTAIVHEGAAGRLLADAEGKPASSDIAAARRLCIGAREQRIAAERLASDLGGMHQRFPGERSLDLSVLVVDDYEDTRAWLSVLLENAGFMVRTASNGLEAVIAAHELQPAVIVMDIMMPVLDGIEAARLISEMDELRMTRMIAYTANSGASPASPFVAVLRKPSAPDVVVETVKRWAATAA
jgi:CheY-like chemotaxis protein